MCVTSSRPKHRRQKNHALPAGRFFFFYIFFLLCPEFKVYSVSLARYCRGHKAIIPPSIHRWNIPMSWNNYCSLFFQKLADQISLAETKEIIKSHKSPRWDLKLLNCKDGHVITRSTNRLLTFHFVLQITIRI